MLFWTLGGLKLVFFLSLGLIPVGKIDCTTEVALCQQNEYSKNTINNRKENNINHLLEVLLTC
jgi:hypothetical protein